MFVESLRAAAIAEAKARTKTWAERNGYAVPVPKEPKSEKAIQVEKALGDPNLSARAGSYAALAALLLDTKIDIVTKPAEAGFVAGCMVVPVGNGNSHNYRLGHPVLNWQSTGRDYFLNTNGTVGNHMSTTPKDLRPATDEEVDTYFAAVSSTVLETIVQEFLSYKVS